MRNTKGIFEFVGGILLIAILFLVFFLAVRPLIPLQGVTQIQATISGEADYPPPYVSPAPETPIVVDTPEDVIPEFGVTDTPIPLTPVPTLTLKPGPELTPIPLISPAKDSEGAILFLVKESKEAKPKVNKVGTGKSGEIASPSEKISVEEMLEDGFVFPSPDGKYLAITAPKGAFRIFDTSKNKTIESAIKIGAYNRFFNWFPDSQKILYGSDALILADLFTGEEAVLVVTGYGYISGAAASPDGKYVVYSYNSSTLYAPGLWIINANGQNAHILYEGTPATNISWSPDGKHIAFHAGGWKVIDADGTNLQEIAPGIAVPQCYFLPPLWSPNSQRLAIVTSKTGDSFCPGWTEDNFRGTNVVIIDVDKKTITPLPVVESTGNIDPIWSPDGQHLAFVSNRTGASEIWVIDVDGTNLQQLTANGQSVRFPQWVKPVGR